MIHGLWDSPPPDAPEIVRQAHRLMLQTLTRITERTPEVLTDPANAGGDRVMRAAIAALANPKIDHALRIAALTQLQTRMREVDPATPKRLFLNAPENRSTISRTVGTDLVALEAFDLALERHILEVRPGSSLRAAPPEPDANLARESLGRLLALLVVRLGQGSTALLGEMAHALSAGAKPAIARHWAWLDITLSAGHRRDDAPAHLAERSTVTLDGSDWRAGVLRLLDQLSDRRRAWRDHGRRGDTRASHGGSRFDQDHGRSRRGTIRDHTGASDRRYRLRHGTARHRCSPGWSMKKVSSRTFRCGINRSARTTASRAATSPGTKEDTVIYRASQRHCANCPVKQRCCPNTAMRKIARSIHESVRDVARRITKTPAYRRSCRERKKVEMLFAHLKRILKLDRLRLRGLTGASDEFTLAATVQNLRRLAKLMPQGPPHRTGVCA